MEVNSLGINLTELFTLDKLEDVFVKDQTITEVEKIQQAKETITFFTKPVKRKNSLTLKGDKTLTPIGREVFDELVISTYDNFSIMQNFLLEDLLGLKSKSIKRAYQNCLDKKFSKEFCVADDLSRILYKPKKLLEDMFGLFSTKIKDKEKFDDNFIENAQLKFFFDLIEKNEKYLAIGRSMSYEMAAIRDFLLTPDDFFSEKEEYKNKKENDHAFARFAFSFTASHIGYFRKPQFGKWEIFYSFALEKDPSEFIGQGNTVVERTEKEKADDIEMQLKGQALLYKALLHKYADVRIKYDDSEKQISTFEKKRLNYEKENEKNRKKIEEQKQKLRNTENQRKESVKKAVKKTEEKYKNLEKKLKEKKELEKELNMYRHRLEEKDIEIIERENENAQYNLQIRELKENFSVLEKELLKYKKEDLYKVEVNIEDKRKKELTQKHNQVLENTKKTLSKTTSCLIPIKKDTDTYNSLSKKYKGYDSFHKIEAADYYRLFVVREEDRLKILDVMTHKEYNRVCKSR